MDIQVVDPKTLGESWIQVIGKRKLVSFIACSDEDGDTLALMEFDTPKTDEHPTPNPSFEVGYGSPLRPYVQYYRGRSAQRASRIWVQQSCRIDNMFRGKWVLPDPKWLKVKSQLK